MSFDEYANHIYQKHRLAVALAILKSKPSNITTDKYLKELITKVDNKMEDDDITVCSDDFLMDDDDEMNDSVTILKDFDSEGINDKKRLKDFGNAIKNDRDDTTSKKPLTLPEDLSQITYYDGSQTEFTTNMADPIGNDISIYKDNHNLNHKSDIEQSIPKNIVNRNEESNEMSNAHHNTVIDRTTNKNNLNTINGNKVSNAEIKDYNHKRVDFESYPANMDVTYYDSQKTVLYSVHGFTDNYTHYSPSQSNILIPNNYIYGTNRNRHVTVVQNKENGNNPGGGNAKMISSQNVYESASETQFVNKEDNIDNIPNNTMYDQSAKNEEFEYSQTMNMFAQNNDEIFDRVQDNLSNNNIHLASEKNRSINDINSINDRNSENKQKEKTNILNTTQYSQNIDEYFEEMQNVVRNITRSNFSYDNNESEHIPEFSDIEMTTEPFGYSQNIDLFSQNIELRNNKNEFDKSNVQNYLNEPTNRDISKENHENDESQNPTADNFENIIPNQLATITNKTDNNNETREELKLEEELDSEEIISYKVLEEFNKVKTFLSRRNRRMSCDGFSTDSGYRSDSHIRNSNRSALQLSGNWLNQSGCCLFNYIMQCHLVASTRDITNEIAQVLSQLIDRLHEEEKYPSFLEDLIETVDILLRQIYEGESCGDSEFIKKDESVQRVLLLNKSIHIQKHSIEKITNILETFHSKVTETDSTYELSNIDQIENISYIFHLLEMLLKKYLKNRDLLSQSSTQQSQDEDKILKKSSITDIWRKKWNPSQKVFEGSREKKCVLKKCSDILNKIVVECVSSYSLVAYSALKCFNAMQS